MEELDEFGIPIKKQTSKVTLDEFGIPIKKKDVSQPTSTPQKSGSGTPTGSSGGVNPAFKNTAPSPIPDFNSMKSVKPVAVKPQVKLQKPPVKEEDSFFDYLKENLDTGLATVSKSVYDAPGLIYDAAASITNPIIKGLTGYKGEGASSDKLAKDLGFRNIPSEILKEKIKVSNEKINAYSTKNGGDALQAVQDGNYVGAAKLVAGTTAQSLPIMVAAMLSGGETTALSAIGLSTASTKNAQLKEENPEMGLGTRVANAANAGIIEAVTGHLFTGASGAVMKKIIADKGVDAGSKIIAKSFRTTIEKSIEKNPLVSAVGEVVEESAVEFGNQVNDMSSGIRAEFDFHAIKNAGLSATGMGGLQTLGVYGAKGYVKAKTYTKLKSNNKEVFKLRNEIENGNLSDANKAILTLRAERLEAENKKLLGTELEKAKALPTEQKAELNALNAEFEGLKTKFDAIDDADDIPTNLKPAMKEEIKLQASKNQKRKTEILSQNDRLEVNDDFSKFEGVEPDFDLENGKISSLPLKEQNRLNKLAVEEITKGDKTIEYTKEQVSETANEIYKNEQTPPTPEAQPQSEVPQQAEAEKVETPNIEKPLSLQEEKVSMAEKKPNFNVDGVEEFHHASNNKRNGRLSVSNAPQFGTGVYFSTNKELVEGEFGDKNTTSVKLNIENPVYAGSNEWGKVEELAIENADKDYGERKGLTLGEDETFFRYDKYNTSEIAEIPSKFISDAAKELGYDSIIDKGSDQYENEIVVLDESKIIYPEDEATPSKDITPDASIRPTASNVGESGNSKQESPVQESVSSSVDGGEVKGDASVGKIIEPHSEVNTDVETVKKELKLNDVESLIYDGFKDIPSDKIIDKVDDVVEKWKDDKYGEIEAIESKINDIDIKIEDNGDAIDKINDDETISPAKTKKAIAVLEKEFKDLQKQQKELEEQKETVNESLKQIDDVLFHPTEDYNVDLINEIVDKVNNRLETRKSVKEGTNLFPEDANIPEFVAIKKELIKLTDEKTIADFNSRTAEQVKESEPIIADIKSKAKNAERISKEELEKGIADAEKLLKPPTTKERIAERIKLSDAKIDNIKDAINGIDSIFGIKIKIDDIEGLNKNGIDIVEVIANIAKQAISAGIHIDEAINKTIEHLKKTIDFDVNIDEIKERINPKKEAEPQKPESTSNDSRREKSSSEKASDLGLTEKQYLDLGNKIKDVPETGVFKKYLSGETIQREYGDPTNDQSYDVVTLKDIAQHGEDMLIQAKELFGDDYVAKTLDYLQVANLNSFEKGIIYAALENLMDTNVKSDPKNKSILKQQALVYADSQANLRVGSLGINTGRLRSVYNAIKNGIDIDKLAGMVYTDKQKEAKTIIEGAVPNGENLNRASDINENSIVDSDLEKLISDGVDKQINEIYKKLPSNRKAKADKAISALENIQKRLRTNIYDASIGLPIAILDAGITVIKNSIKAGVNISDAIEIGINHIKEKYGKKWDKENDFRKDMHDGFGTEGIDSKERSPKEKSKVNGVKETVKQALIDAGFYREIKGKNGVNKVLDWVKLVGRDASVEGLKKNVEEQLKKQGFDDAKIAEISNELETEYRRLAKDILDKATADLERRNLIKPSPNRKSDNQRLVDLYNEGLFGDNIKKYENVVNRILGFSDIDNKNYKEIKQKLFALAELYKAENDGKRVSEQSINAVSNDLNHAISNLMSISAFKEAPTKFKIASLAFEYGVLAQKALLGGIKTLAENVISGDFAVMGNKATTGKYMTPELQKQSKANVKAVKNDIVENAGLYYGDTTTSLVTHSIIEDIVNQKIKSKAGHVIMSAVTLRRWLDAKDSAIKVRLTDALFVKNAVTILTSKTNPNGAMTEENAIQFVSEALTGDNFSKALVSAKAIIDDVNSKQETKQLKDNPEAVHRFAMELVRENLMSGNKMTMAQIEDSFNAAYKSAGRSIGHEANNPISRQVNMGNAYLSEQLNKAVSNKEWSKATALMVQSLVMRAVVQPFAGGGANWTVIGAEKGVPIIGYISTAFNYAHRTPLELNSVIGVKNTKESLYRENNFKESAVRNVIGTGFAVLAYVAMVGYKDDDDENYAKKFNDWMNKPENQWVRPYFNKLTPTAFSFMVAMEDEELGRYLSQLFGVGGENFNDTLKVIKSIDNTKEGTTSGAIGKLVGKPFSSPFAWKAVKDTRDIYRGLAGLEPIKYSYKTNGFMNGYLQGGLLEQLGLRPDLKIDHNSQEQIFLKEQKEKELLYKKPENQKVKIRVDRKLTRVESDIKMLKNLQMAQQKGLPYFISMDAALTKQQVKDMDLSGTDESVAEIKRIVSEVKAQYGIEDEEE